MRKDRNRGKEFAFQCIHYMEDFITRMEFVNRVKDKMLSEHIVWEIVLDFEVFTERLSQVIDNQKISFLVAEKSRKHWITNQTLSMATYCSFPIFTCKHVPNIEQNLWEKMVAIYTKLK